MTLSLPDHIKNNLGAQPLAGLMTEHKLMPHDLVSHSTEQLTHKMVSRAVKGRRLTPKIQYRVMNALNKAVNKEYTLEDIFNY
jgi:hypothetical protein